MSIWGIMILGGLGTFLIRLSFIWLFERLTIPPLLQRGLRFVPPAVLSVIIFQELLIQDGAIQISLDNTRLIAGIFASLVAWRTRSPLLTILSGMVALYILQALLPS